MTRNYYLFLFILITSLQLAYLSACTKKDTEELKREKPEKKLEHNPANRGRIKIIHLFKDTVYTLSDPFTRESGEQLIIDPGTIIKCNGVNASIRVFPGGIIQATGTNENPVVFTSGSYLGTQRAGDWNGIFIEGKSANNSSNAAADVTDFSGTLNFVRIEFASLTLKSVGSRSVIENVQVSYGFNEPSFKIEGGTFNARNLVSYASNAPSDFYFTNGYQGRMQNLLAYRHPYFANTTNSYQGLLTGLYIENNQFSNQNAHPITFAAISNMTVLGPGNETGVLNLYADTSIRNAAWVTTGHSLFSIRNSLFMGFKAAGWYLNDSLSGRNLVQLRASCLFSIFENISGNRTFFLKPGSYPPFTSNDFKNFILDPRFHNILKDSITLKDPYNYNNPNPFPKEDSLLLNGADFTGIIFSDPFFRKQQYKGALGKENWMTGWTNFTPLKTNYNFYN